MRLGPDPDRPPPGPFRPSFWRSPLRGPWLTTAIGVLLLAGMVVTAATGFLSHMAYEPDLRGNAIIPVGRDLPFTLGWPASPDWLYAVTQGLHVNVGLATIPFLLAKLWSVIPRLFAWPPARSPAHAVERLSIALLVGSAIFQLVTGVLNVQYWYAFDFNFVVAHYYGAVVFVASLAIHLVIKLPAMRRAWRVHDGLKPLRARLEETEPEPLEAEMEEGLVPHDPAAPTMTRRGVLAFAGAGSVALVGLNVGESIGGPLRSTALLAPRRPTGEDFPVNKTFRASRIPRAMVADTAWRLELRGPGGSRSFARSELLGMEQHTAELPIACVEGWTTTQTWTGVRLRDLAALVGGEDCDSVYVVSLQQAILGEGSLDGDTVRADDALLALAVNGHALPLDHGFPARIIVPALPGVRQTKWVARMEFVV
ncbi:molybdopterin-dependent oxidoreductase [Conexibacter sp. SYSU D00693]|uniref:molybdopterin-dependent oxidoreductase n=1 Tax=Conexibacter sp. SYSU D00693 TaxID=2812560 RepID=UPI00196A4B1D|nr:molybdopterin-dependent oxidoreductase [Conexibacter sp. SYSU D00693]